MRKFSDTEKEVIGIAVNYIFGAIVKSISAARAKGVDLVKLWQDARDDNETDIFEAIGIARPKPGTEPEPEPGPAPDTFADYNKWRTVKPYDEALGASDHVYRRGSRWYVNQGGPVQFGVGIGDDRSPEMSELDHIVTK